MPRSSGYYPPLRAQWRFALRVWLGPPCVQLSLITIRLTRASQDCALLIKNALLKTKESPPSTHLQTYQELKPIKNLKNLKTCNKIRPQLISNRFYLFQVCLSTHHLLHFNFTIALLFAPLITEQRAQKDSERCPLSQLFTQCVSWAYLRG